MDAYMKFTQIKAMRDETGSLYIELENSLAKKFIHAVDLKAELAFFCMFGSFCTLLTLEERSEGYYKHMLDNRVLLPTATTPLHLTWLAHLDPSGNIVREGNEEKYLGSLNYKWVNDIFPNQEPHFQHLNRSRSYRDDDLIDPDDLRRKRGRSQ